MSATGGTAGRHGLKTNGLALDAMPMRAELLGFANRCQLKTVPTGVAAAANYQAREPILRRIRRVSHRNRSNSAWRAVSE
jgi:hypothetical protein